jgi:nitrate reductase NapAB chaperone NapD
MVAAFVFVQVSSTASWADASAMHGALHGVPGVKTVHFLAGPTDIILFVEAADQKALMESIAKVRGVKGVASTDTRPVWPV